MLQVYPINQTHPSMSIKCKPSCTQTPCQLPKQRAIRSKASCTTLSQRRHVSMVYTFSEEKYSEGVALLKEQQSCWQR